MPKKPMKKMKLSAFVVNAMVDQMQSKQLRAGDQLPPERTLAENMGVSRTVVREALQLLHDKGLIYNAGGVWTVCPVAVDPILGRIMREYMPDQEMGQELMEVRDLLEEYSARRAAERATPESIEKMQESIDNMRRMLEEKGKYSDDYELAFHAELIRAAGNHVVDHIYALCGDILTAPGKAAFQEALREELAGLTVQEHQSILDAIRARDGALAAQQMHRHLDYAHRHVVSRFWQDTDLSK